MATAPCPSPFFLPTPPFGFGAPPYAPYPPPNPIHHHPLPPPSPPYHYAAVSPPPPPGFVPVPTYAPAPAPPQPSPTHQHPPYLWSTPPTPCPPPFSTTARSPHPRPQIGAPSGSCSLTRLASAATQILGPPTPPSTSIASPATSTSAASAPHSPAPSTPLLRPTRNPPTLCPRSPPPAPHPPRLCPPPSQAPQAQAPAGPLLSASTPTSSIAPPRSAGARAPPAARGPVPASHLRLEQLPAVVSLPEQAAVPSTSNGAAELGHSSGRSPYPTTSAPHAGSRAPQPVHAPEPPFAPAAYDASVPGTADDRAQVKEAIHHRLQRELLSIKARMDQQQEFERNSFATIRGEISRLSEVAVRLASSLGRANNPSIQFKPEQFSVPAVPAYVAPQVFGEMPAQNSLQETHGSASDYCSGHHNLTQSPCVSNLSEQNLDYSLEQAAPAPVFDVDDVDTKGCTDEYVDVCACNPGRQPSEEEQYESRQAPERFSKPTVGVFNLANELNPDTEPMAVCVNKASANAFSQYATEFTSILVPRLIVDEPIKCSVRKLKTELHSLPESALCYTHGNPKHVKNQQCNMQIGEQGREDWDPGILKTIMKIPSVVNWSSLEGLPHSVNFSPNILLSMIVYAATSIPNILVSFPLHMLWDPGEHTFRSSTQNRDSVGVLPTSLLTEETTNHLTECSTLKYFLQSAEIRYPCILSCFFVLRYSNVKHITWLNTVLQSLGDHVECMNPLSLTTPWDPGVLVLHCGITCSNTRFTRAAIWSKFSSPTSCELPQSSSVKWRTFHMLSNYLNAIFSPRMMQNAKQCLRYCYREVTEDCLADQELMKNTSCRVAVLTWHSSVTGTPFLLLNNTNYTWDPGALKIKDTMLSKITVPNLMDLKHFWAQLLLPYEFWCTTLNAFLQVQESCLPIVLDCLYTETVQQLVCYSRMFSSTEAILSAVCMPTITTVHMIQLVDYSAIHACYMVYALLPHTQITASGSSNLEVHELASPYVGFHLHPSTKWTSTSPNGFQKNYNAKSLISPQKYLQLSKMDIIFSTFLPP